MRPCMQAATGYKPEQRASLLASQDALFGRMHEILEAREAIMNTLQANFPSAETEHKNAPLYVQVRRDGPAVGLGIMHAARVLLTCQKNAWPSQPQCC